MTTIMRGLLLSQSPRIILPQQLPALDDKKVGESADC
jgi:hypothetical protein